MALYWKSINSNRFKSNKLFTFGGDFIYTNDKKPSKYNTLCEKNVRKLVKTTIIVIILLIFSHIIYATGSMYAVFFKNTRVTLLGTKLPFVERETDIGFTLNVMEQSIAAYYELMGSISIEVGQTLVNNVFTTFPKLIRYDLDELTNELQSEGMCLHTKMRLRNIIMKIQDFDG